ncbi:MULTISPECIES: hypothetical protein [Sphingomonas]|uniref:hypothetical protein n=1 Tax=Sphingomonas TaxID=13687 RepID=UPI000DEFCB3B|nr:MULTISPECIES: hypothetical protein [Sphingomonas]
MRIFLSLMATLLAAAAPPVPVNRTASMPVSNPYAASKGCPETPMSLARKQADKPQLKRLNKLPSASAFAAVDRRVGGCPAPLTLTRHQFGR